MRPHGRVFKVLVRIAPAHAVRRIVLVHAGSVAHVVPCQSVTKIQRGKGVVHLPPMHSMRLQTPLSTTTLSANSVYICLEKDA